MLSACFRLVWEGHDFARLLVLLGPWFHAPFAFWCQLISGIQILSIAFELAEYSLQHQLANFVEVGYITKIDQTLTQRRLQCWWDHVSISTSVLPYRIRNHPQLWWWVVDSRCPDMQLVWDISWYVRTNLDSLLLNQHFFLGMKVCQYFEVKVRLPVTASI